MKKAIIIILALLVVAVGFFFIFSPPQAKEIKWGANFSQKHVQGFGMDWKEVYSALIEDLGVKDIKLATYWDLIEGQEGEYDFEDLDWQVRKSEEKGVELLLVIGMHTPRWPECHIPEWAKDLDKNGQQEKILSLLEKIIIRYQGSDSIKRWQVENEPFFPFGDCPWVDKEFLKKEINLVKSLDPQKRPIVISDTGEWSLWITAAQLGDIPGTTMYRKVWIRQFGFYLTYPLPPSFYYFRAKLVEALFGKEVICVELQAEPWGPKLLYDSPLEEQEKTMNLEQFKKNVEFAKSTGMKEFYLWGPEWWYWMKEKQNNSEIWDEARGLF